MAHKESAAAPDAAAEQRAERLAEQAEDPRLPGEALRRFACYGTVTREYEFRAVVLALDVHEARKNAESGVFEELSEDRNEARRELLIGDVSEVTA